jgi:Bacteriophage HK97-gp10, putative tail-component
MAEESALGFIWEGVSAFKDAIDRIVAKAGDTAEQIVTEGGHLVEAAAKARAPVVTGTLRRSITVAEITPIGAGGWMSTTGPTTAYGRRIELGFHGVDRIGRHYNQGGHPYLSPALLEVGSQLQDLADSRWAAALA